MGVSYVVLAPEHNLVLEITTECNINKVKNYIEESSKQSEIDRISSSKEKREYLLDLMQFTQYQVIKFLFGFRITL